MSERFAKAHKALMGRSTWEQKQRVFYEMRHEGIRRINKPFPTASDAHFPLIDMTIEKWKPFWLAQALAGDRLAAFVSLNRHVNQREMRVTRRRKRLVNPAYPFMPHLVKHPLLLFPCATPHQRLVRSAKPLIHTYPSVNRN